MDPRVAGAGVAMAIGMMLLLPTFNALNDSYVENVPPPPWLPTPDELPDDFTPPDDFVPPTPPPDWEPPPGWEPPPDYDGPIPPGGCPPPVAEPIAALDDQWTMDPRTSERDIPFTIPKYTVAVLVNVTITQWSALEIAGVLDLPDGTSTDEEREQGDVGGLLTAAQTTAKTSWVFQVVAEDEDSMPPQGEYTLRMNANTPIQGTWTTEGVAVIACGGILE